jgi:signal peptidase I
MLRRKTVIISLSSLLFLVILNGILRTYVVAGPSDAPSYIRNDRVIVNNWAYNLNVPYTTRKLASWSDPKRGDMVILTMHIHENQTALKRIVGLPGDTVEMKDNVLFINGKPLEYQVLDSSEFRQISENNSLGSVIAIERGLNHDHYITYTPGFSDHASFGPITVNPGHYFILGDNRDNSFDSRMLGQIPRRLVHGKLIGTLYRASNRYPD